MSPQIPGRLRSNGAATEQLAKYRYLELARKDCTDGQARTEADPPIAQKELYSGYHRPDL